MKRVVVTHSPEETERFGQWVGVHLRRGDVVGLIGDLGSGKTCLTRGIAAGCGVNPAAVSSPTFVFIHEYPLPQDETRRPPVLYHIDLYRLDSPREFTDMGGEETFTEEGICVIEWADRILPMLPEDALRLRLTIRGECSREIEMEGDAVRFEWLNALDRWRDEPYPPLPN